MKTLSKSFTTILLSVFSAVAFANKVDLNKADRRLFFMELINWPAGWHRRQPATCYQPAQS